uniref:Uncharacterized protein n=1 Tax=Macrostomum lignano TaxID=282301 RepID=A0A1I8FR72_9PLAT
MQVLVEPVSQAAADPPASSNRIPASFCATAATGRNTAVATTAAAATAATAVWHSAVVQSRWHPCQHCLFARQQLRARHSSGTDRPGGAEADQFPGRQLFTRSPSDGQQAEEPLRQRDRLRSLPGVCCSRWTPAGQ